jgi:hypothetical protein
MKKPSCFWLTTAVMTVICTSWQQLFFVLHRQLHNSLNRNLLYVNVLRCTLFKYVINELNSGLCLRCSSNSPVSYTLVLFFLHLSILWFCKNYLSFQPKYPMKVFSHPPLISIHIKYVFSLIHRFATTY